MKTKKSLRLKTYPKFARAKKALGQNFLKNKNILKKIVEAEEVTRNDIVLEIGPGRGALTEKLLEKAKTVIAVEKDDKLFKMLQEKFSSQIKTSSLVLVHGDILKFNIKKNLKTQDYKIIANIPYNITGAILKKFLTAENQPKTMILMVQHEVARRIIAQDGKESILSISVKAYGKPKLITKVDKRYFSPAPKVNSAVIKISHINRKIFKENKINEEKFWKIVKKGFAHKRKKLSGNLKNVISNKKLLSTNFKDKRAEDLTLLSYYPGTQGFASYNIPFTRFLLGSYTPSGVCVLPTTPPTFIFTQGTITPMVGSSPI